MTQASRLKKFSIRFVKWSVIVLLLLVLIAYFLNQRFMSSCGFRKLSKDSIDYIVLYKYDFIKSKNRFSAYNQYKDSIVFTERQINLFVRKWNNSYTVGPCKYLPKFDLKIKMENGQYRNFRSNGENIKEKNDWCYKFVFGNIFFESIWNEKYGK